MNKLMSLVQRFILHLKFIGAIIFNYLLHQTYIYIFFVKYFYFYSRNHYQLFISKLTNSVKPDIQVEISVKPELTRAPIRSRLSLSQRLLGTGPTLFSFFSFGSTVQVHMKKDKLLLSHWHLRKIHPSNMYPLNSHSLITLGCLLNSYFQRLGKLIVNFYFTCIITIFFFYVESTSSSSNYLQKYFESSPSKSELNNAFLCHNNGSALHALFISFFLSLISSYSLLNVTVSVPVPSCPQSQFLSTYPVPVRHCCSCLSALSCPCHLSCLGALYLFLFRFYPHKLVSSIFLQCLYQASHTLLESHSFPLILLMTSVRLELVLSHILPRHLLFPWPEPEDLCLGPQHLQIQLSSSRNSLCKKMLEINHTLSSPSSVIVYFPSKLFLPPEKSPNYDDSDHRLKLLCGYSPEETFIHPTRNGRFDLFQIEEASYFPLYQIQPSKVRLGRYACSILFLLYRTLISNGLGLTILIYEKEIEGLLQVGTKNCSGNSCVGSLHCKTNFQNILQLTCSMLQKIIHSNHLFKYLYFLAQ
ncbi:hypothetical protein VP01_3489g1 [Puccinia sorghi]|uniref:Uncharacterized protein n=1 Tax=Puccinia sorghi TaxID=27349 RepID=A0A0L6UWN7_9BASI|nr:hypothetical protein VP01_3489g1 [Puccinia sorghi]